MQTLVTVIHIIACVLIILLVLVQSGKGAEISASFGGSSQTVFGSSGGANFFTQFTAAMAALFFITSIGLTIMKSQSRKSLLEGVSAPAATSPAVPVPAPVPSAH